MSEQDNKNGHLVIIGGHEDRTREMAILKRFVELSGGGRAERFGAVFEEWQQYVSAAKIACCRAAGAAVL